VAHSSGGFSPWLVGLHGLWGWGEAADHGRSAYLTKEAAHLGARKQREERRSQYPLEAMPQ
jgi:hypothetical protein